MERMFAYSDWLNPTAYNAADWAGLTFVVLLGAAVVAWFQVREARKLREARLRPFVTIDFDLHQTIVDMVIENVGPTLARNVRFTFDPPLRSSRDDEGEKKAIADASLFKNGIPSLPPGKRIVFVFDRSPVMIERELPLTYRVRIDYTGDPLGRTYSEEMVIDLNIHRGVSRLIKYDIHDVAKRLDEISKEVRRWTTFGNALHVMTPRDVEERNAEIDAFYAAQASEASAEPTNGEASSEESSE